MTAVHARTTLVLTVAAMTVAALPVLPAAAQDSTANSWTDEPRELSWTTARYEGFTFESVRNTSTANDVVRGEFDLREGRLVVTHIDRARPQSTDVSLVLDIVSISEFEDGNSDGQFDLFDRVVKRARLYDTMPPSFLDPAFMADGVLHLRARFVHSGWGYVELEVLVPSEPTTVAGERLAPTEVMINLTTNGFRFDATNSSLVLEQRLRSHTESTDVSANNLSGVMFQQDRRRVSYTWTNHVLVDGLQRGANVTVLDQRLSDAGDGPDHETILLHAMPRGERVIASHQVGFTPAQERIEQVTEAVLRGDWRVFAVGLITAGAVIAISTMVKLRHGTSR